MVVQPKKTAANGEDAIREVGELYQAAGIATAEYTQSMIDGVTQSASILEHLIACGSEAPVFLVANLDGGAEWNAQHMAANRERIFYLNYYVPPRHVHRQTVIPQQAVAPYAYRMYKA